MTRPFTTFGNKPRKPLAPFSAKRLREHGRRAEVVQIVRERDQWCRLNPRSVHYPRVQVDALQADLPYCAGQLDVHEVLTRARGGNYLDPDECVLVCRHHHDWIDTHQMEAHALGMLRHSWDQDSPAAAPSPVDGDEDGSTAAHVGYGGRGASQ